MLRNGLFPRKCLGFLPRTTAKAYMHIMNPDTGPKMLELMPRAKYGGESIVTLLTGSGTVGAQGANYIRTLIEMAKVPICFEHMIVEDETKGTGAGLRNDFIVSVMRNRTAIHVDLQHTPEEKHKSLLLNSQLDLYASIIRLHSIEGFNCRNSDLDITMVIQNTAGDFSKLEYNPVDGMVETLTNTHRETLRRYVKFVFDYAVRNNRRKVTMCHKLIWLPIGDGLLISMAKEMHATEPAYKSFEFEALDVRRVVRRLIQNPGYFDVICSNYRYGTAVASVAAAVCGGPGLFSAIEIGDHHAVFKPLQTKLSYTGYLELCPYGVVRACIDLLLHLGNKDCAHIMAKELADVMLRKKIKTPEFGGTNTGQFIISNIVNNLKCRFF